MAKRRLYISYKRKPVETPESLVENGKAHFGTFKDPFKNINILDCESPFGTLIPSIMNKYRLSEWEAFEVNMDEGILVCAVYNNLNMIGMGLCVFYNKEENKIYSFRQESLIQNITIGENLLKSKSEMKVKHFELEINNDLENNKFDVVGKMSNKEGDRINFNFTVNKIAPCSNVSIPLGENRPVYSEKDFLLASGEMTLNGNTYHTKENSVAIIDDHKGYYPYKTHYDWVTTMGMIEIDGKENYFGLNLTRNQTTNHNDYNENVIWTEGKVIPLPPVRFKYDEHNRNIWYIKDIYGHINLLFEIKESYEIPIHLGVIDVSYRLPFGTLYGEVKDQDGKVYKLNNFFAIGEDKSTRL